MNNIIPDLSLQNAFLSYGLFIYHSRSLEYLSLAIHLHDPIIILGFSLASLPSERKLSYTFNIDLGSSTCSLGSEYLHCRAIQGKIIKTTAWGRK